MISIAAQLIGHELSVYSSSTLSSNSIGSDLINFMFDGNWDGYNKTVLFWGADSEVPYGAVLDSDNNAVIPLEVLTDKGTFRFGVFGEDSENIRPRITSTIVKIKVLEGAFGSYIVGDEEATPTLVEQLRQIVLGFDGEITSIQNAVDTLRNDADDLITNVDGLITDVDDLKTAMDTKISGMTIASVTDTFPSSTDHISLTAPSVTGFTFLCWLSVISSGRTVPVNIYNPSDSNSSIWRPGSDTSNSLDVTAYALYIKR